MSLTFAAAGALPPVAVPSLPPLAHSETLLHLCPLPGEKPVNKKSFHFIYLQMKWTFLAK